MGTPPTIGVLSPFVSGFYFGAIIRGIAAAAAEAGVRLVAIQTSDPGIVYYDRPVNLPHPHAAGWEHLDGCIVVIDAATPPYQEAILRSGKPIVTISRPFGGLDCPTVRPNNRQGARDAVRHPHCSRAPQDRVRRHDASRRHP